MTKTLLCFASAAAFALAVPAVSAAKDQPAPAATPAAPATPSSAGERPATPATPATPPATTPPASTPPAGTPPASDNPPGASGAATGSSADTSATAAAPSFAVGTPLKDNTGAVIGSITEVKDGAGGKMATIKMGEDQFSVATANLALQDGAAVINMTRAELTAKLHPPK